MIDRDIEFVLLKRKSTLWPRLMKDTKKPQWLKVDFDRWKQTEDSDREEEEENVDNWHKTSQNSFRDIGRKDFGRGRKRTEGDNLHVHRIRQLIVLNHSDS